MLVFFCLCFFSLSARKGGFSLCLCLDFDLRIAVDVCKGGIQLHHEGFSLAVGLASSESCSSSTSITKIPILLDNRCYCLLIFFQQINMLYAKVLSVVFVVFNSMVLFDFYLYILAMYGLCL